MAVTISVSPEVFPWRNQVLQKHQDSRYLNLPSFSRGVDRDTPAGLSLQVCHVPSHRIVAECQKTGGDKNRSLHFGSRALLFSHRSLELLLRQSSIVPARHCPVTLLLVCAAGRGTDYKVSPSVCTPSSASIRS